MPGLKQGGQRLVDSMVLPSKVYMYTYYCDDFASEERLASCAFAPKIAFIDAYVIKFMYGQLLSSGRLRCRAVGGDTKVHDSVKAKWQWHWSSGPKDKKRDKLEIRLDAPQ